MKRFFIVVLTIILTFSSFVFAQEDAMFNVSPYNFKIFWTGNQLRCDSPILLVNGQTYVPLRDWSEQIGMDVHWDGEAQTITITEADIEFEDVFSSTLGFGLPQNSKVIDYAYGRYGQDVSLYAKVFFEEIDLQYMQKQLESIGSLLEEDEMNDEEIELINISKKYDWWDITSPKEAQYAYFGFMEGHEIVTYSVWGLICKAPDSNGYYLYVSH